MLGNHTIARSVLRSAARRTVNSSLSDKFATAACAVASRFALTVGMYRDEPVAAPPRSIAVSPSDKSGKACA
jgi:hypothetical protein